MSDQPPQPITQPAMAAVILPTALDARVAALEVKVGTVAEDVSALKERAKSTETKVTTLETDMGTLKTDMSVVKEDAAFTRAETTKQTLSLARIEAAVVPAAKAVGAAVDTPMARKLLGAIVVVLLGAVTAWLANKGFRFPQ